MLFALLSAPNWRFPATSGGRAGRVRFRTCSAAVSETRLAHGIIRIEAGQPDLSLGRPHGPGPERGFPGYRSGRVAGVHGPVGFRQVHALPSPGPAGQSDLRKASAGRPGRVGAGRGRSRGTAQQEDRVRVPEFQPCAGVDRPRKRAASAAFPSGPRKPRAQAGGRSAGSGRPDPLQPAEAQPAFRRAAAARGDRASLGDPRRSGDRGRADSQPGLRGGREPDGPDPEAQRRAEDHVSPCDA